MLDPLHSKALRWFVVGSVVVLLGILCGLGASLVVVLSKLLALTASVAGAN